MRAKPARAARNTSFGGGPIVYSGQRDERRQSGDLEGLTLRRPTRQARSARSLSAPMAARTRSAIRPGSPSSIGRIGSRRRR